MTTASNSLWYVCWKNLYFNFIFGWTNDKSKAFTYTLQAAEENMRILREEEGYYGVHLTSA